MFSVQSALPSVTRRNMLHPLVSQLCRSPIPRCAAMVMLFALAWSSGCAPTRSGSRETATSPASEIRDAARTGDLDKLKSLLKDNPDLVSSKDNHNQTSLHWAAAKGQTDVTRFLLAQNADVNATAYNGETPLIFAAVNGHKDVVEMLLARKADVNAKGNSGETALEAAAINGHREVVEALLANKADVGAKDSDGQTSLQMAAHMGHKDVVEVLLANKAEINAKANNGATPLHAAAAKGHKDVVKVLLANSADLNAKSKDGLTPLGVAQANGHTAVAALLAEALVSRSMKMSTTTAPQRKVAGFGIEIPNLNSPAVNLTPQSASITLSHGTEFLMIEFVASSALSSLAIVKDEDIFLSTAAGDEKEVGYVFTDFGWLRRDRFPQDSKWKGEERFLFIVDRRRLNEYQFHFGGSVFSVRDFLGPRRD
jgi:ankyrin repeat protein